MKETNNIVTKNIPTRKIIRLAPENYVTNNSFFITICTKNKKNEFWKTNECDNKININSSVLLPLSDSGIVVNDAICNITNHYPDVLVHKYVIMPNHIHMILDIQCDKEGKRITNVSISTVIKQLKGYVTKQIGRPVWQARFYDHIITDQKEYEKIWNYIDTNPAIWTNDIYFE